MKNILTVIAALVLVGCGNKWGPSPTFNDINDWVIIEPLIYKKELFPKSISGKKPLFVLMQNNYSFDIDAIWLDYNGNGVSYGVIRSGESRLMPTFSSHPWLFKDIVNEEIISFYVVPEYSCIIQLDENINENFKAATQLSDEEISEVLSIRLGKWSFVDNVVIENGKKVKALKETPLEIFTAVWKEIGKSVAVNGIVGEKSYQADMIYKPQLGLFVETFNDGVIRHSFWSRHSKSIMSKVISPKHPSGAKESIYIRKDNANQISGEFEAEINGKIVYALEFKGTRNLEKN